VKFVIVAVTAKGFKKYHIFDIKRGFGVLYSYLCKFCSVINVC